MNDQRKLGLDDAYAVKTPAENRALYRDWADTYEEDFIQPRGYVYHENVAALFGALRGASDGPILDVGCGTGIVGVALAQQGYGVIDGLDLSPEMLKQSATKGVYRHLIEADLTTTLPLPDQSYDGIVSVGTFTHGHVGPAALDELVRLASPGACFALGINAEHFESHGFAAAFERLAAAGSISTPTLEHVRIYAAATDSHAEDLALTALFTAALGSGSTD